MPTNEMIQAEREVLEEKWFYRFELPSGRRTESYAGEEVQRIHDTRREMLFAALEPVVGDRWSTTTCLDIACHQGYFSSLIAARGCAKVLGVDIRPEHVKRAELIRRAYGYGNLEFRQADVFSVAPEATGQFDVVLMLGLIYHLENPIDALRVAARLTRRVCVIETQLCPEPEAATMEWGSRENLKEIMGCFGVIDETDEIAVENKEANIAAISLVPSLKALRWIMSRVGFSRVELLPPPPGAHEQIARGNRAMVAGYRE